MKKYKYALRYTPNIEHREEGYTKEDIIGNCGLTDCFLGISILLPEDGSYSQCIAIKDNGKEKRQMTQAEIFKAWMTLGISLHEEGQLKGWHADFASLHTETIRSMFKFKDNVEKLREEQ